MMWGGGGVITFAVDCKQQDVLRCINDVGGGNHVYFLMNWHVNKFIQFEILLSSWSVEVEMPSCLGSC